MASRDRILPLMARRSRSASARLMPASSWATRSTSSWYTITPWVSGSMRSISGWGVVPSRLTARPRPVVRAGGGAPAPSSASASPSRWRVWRSMYSRIMPLSATPGRMMELAATTSPKSRQCSRSNSARMPGDSM